MAMSSLEQWYADRCNGQWEQSYGIRIDSLDNPGWLAHIALRDTKKRNSELAKVRIDRDRLNWIHYWVENNEFHIACGPTNLSEAMDIFVRWFDCD